MTRKARAANPTAPFYLGQTHDNVLMVMKRTGRTVEGHPQVLNRGDPELHLGSNKYILRYHLSCGTSLTFAHNGKQYVVTEIEQ